MSKQKLIADNGTALTLSWLGLLIGPLAIVGMIMGLRLRSQTNYKYGNGAFAVGLILTVNWGMVLISLLNQR